jgi:molybdopterin-guanine dinucleotide biosynthesis protein A
VSGRSILDRQLAVLRGLTPHVFIVAQDERRVGQDVPVVTDRIADAGPLGGVYTALRTSPVERVLVLACDMPFVTEEFLGWLAARDPDADVVLPRDAHGIHPLCAVYHVRVAERLRQQLDAGQRAVHAAIEGWRLRHVGPDELAPFDADGRLLMNVNTREDYEKAITE